MKALNDFMSLKEEEKDELFDELDLDNPKNNIVESEKDF